MPNPVAVAKALVKTLWQKFNITPEERTTLHTFQAGKCAICKRELELGQPSVTVDHNHKDGRVLGLLCFMCNRALGLFGDSPERLQAALLYLVNPPAIAAIGERFGHIGRATRKHGKIPRKDFYSRNEPGSAGVTYLCGCRDATARPKKVCPAHGQERL